MTHRIAVKYGWVTMVWLALAGAALAAELTPPDARRPLARFELKDLKGKRVSSRDLDGKVAVISFWATWCTPCKQELSALDSFRKQYKSQGLTVLAIATDGPETLSLVRSTARRKRWRLTVLTDTDGAVNSLLNPRGTVPYSVFVDRRGRIAYVHAGYKSGDEVKYKKVLKSLLAEARP
jgi:peroxiredoxin